MVVPNRWKYGWVRDVYATSQGLGAFDLEQVKVILGSCCTYVEIWPYLENTLEWNRHGGISCIIYDLDSLGVIRYSFVKMSPYCINSSLKSEEKKMFGLRGIWSMHMGAFDLKHVIIWGSFGALVWKSTPKLHLVERSFSFHAFVTLMCSDLQVILADHQGPWASCCGFSSIPGVKHILALRLKLHLHVHVYHAAGNIVLPKLLSSCSLSQFLLFEICGKIFAPSPLW